MTHSLTTSPSPALRRPPHLHYDVPPAVDGTSLPSSAAALTSPTVAAEVVATDVDMGAVDAAEGAVEYVSPSLVQ